ncbi:hypothetical protein EW145_g3198 [Phellinidium pouzarii]|uniref:Rho-GAP domain-containing protein n=1 Tax=Phellinidium pouzarii TaxID=167371 RepID=A0A4S4L8F2_9AGAM|nr:hypothetical protein EW145_g3198 [Phellinidium pouzarii]
MPPPPLTLKQRLANLSSATSAPSGPRSPLTPPARSSSFGALSSALGKRKVFTNTPWANGGVRTSAGSGPADEHGAMQRVDDVLPRMVSQAGVDYETRPMVVMNASAFPDPRTVSYDLLLSRILSYLDLFAESDYTVVFFAAGGHHTPSWNWVWKAYRSLNRKYRKNLKRLYIVHSSFFSKMLFSLAGAIISPKFFRKITYIDTLSSLACHVPLTQIDIPPSVYSLSSENLKHESQISLPTPVHSHMFGVGLEDIMGFDGEKDGLPRVVRDCIQYLRETGLEEEGLFRRSPNSAQLRQVREAYNRGQTVSLHSFGDPHLAAVLLKKFLRDLPNPIFSESTYDVIRRCPSPRNEQNEFAAIMYIRETLLPELAPCTLILLSNVLLLLHEVSLRSDTNRMDAHNLAIVLTPNLVASGNPLKDVAICAVAGSPEPLSPGTRTAPPPTGAAERSRIDGKTTLGTIIRLCIHRYFEVFDEIADRAEALDADPFNLGEVDEVPSSSSSSPSLPNAKRQSSIHDDEDSIDDAMLIMPMGPNSPSPTARRFPGAQVQPPSSWASSASSAVRSIASAESRAAVRLSALGSVSKAKARSLLTPSPSAESTGVASRRGDVCSRPRITCELAARLSAQARDPNVAAQTAQYNSLSHLADSIKDAMLGSIRTSWEQGTATGAILELDNPEYAVYANNPFKYNGNVPVTALRLALSAAVRQAPDGRLSQVINDGEDEAALDGASAAPYTLLGTFTEPSRAEYWQDATDRQLNYLLYTAPRTKTGAISMRNNAKQYWDDGVFMGPPFLAYYGAVKSNKMLLQMAYDNCRLYRNALLIDGPTGKLWAHIYDEDNRTFTDKGLWATGNAWAALGMTRVYATIMKTMFAKEMESQTSDLLSWVKEILDGIFPAINSDNLLPDYVAGGATFGDASSSAALASVAYRAAVLRPDVFGSNYTKVAGKLANAVLRSVDDLGLVSPYVDPLNWGQIGILSTEGQAFSLMLLSAWRDWIASA